MGVSGYRKLNKHSVQVFTGEDEVVREGPGAVQQTIYGFSGEGLAPTGSIRLPITAVTTPMNKTLLTTFIVVDCPSAYNAIIGWPILVDL